MGALSALAALAGTSRLELSPMKLCDSSAAHECILEDSCDKSAGSFSGSCH